MNTLATPGYEQHIDITTRCRNMGNQLREIYGTRYAGKLVGDLVAKYDGAINWDFEQELTGLLRDAMKLERDVNHIVSDDEYAAEQAMKEEALYTEMGDAIRESKYLKGL